MLDRDFLDFARRSNRGTPGGPARYEYEYLLVVARKAGADRPQERAGAGTPPVLRMRISQTPPATTIPSAISWATVSPTTTRSLRRRNSTRNRSAPASTR